MKNRATTALTYAVLLLCRLNDTLAAYTVDRYEGSRREAFIQRFEGWWKAVRRAYAYSHDKKNGAKHKYRRFQKNVSQNTPDTARMYTAKDTTAERYTGKRRNPDNRAYRGSRRMPRQPWNLLKDTSPAVPCTDTRTPDGLICVPQGYTVTGRIRRDPHPVFQNFPAPADPWAEYAARNNKEHNVRQQTPDLGRGQDRTGTLTLPAQQVHAGQGGSDHHRPGGQAHRGGGLQRTAIGLPARLDAVFSLVSEGRSDSGEPRGGAVPGVRRLPVSARGGERPDAQRPLSPHKRFYLRHQPRMLRLREADRELRAVPGGR